MWCPLPCQPSRGCVADRPGPAAASSGFCLPALLLRLAVGFPSLPLRPAAGKQWEKGELRQVDMGRRRGCQEGSRESLQRCLLSHVRNGAYLFFVPFHQRPVSGWAWQRVGRVGMLGFTAGTGQKEGSLFLHDFCRWDAPVFDCLAKSPGRQPRSHLPSFGWQHQGLWTHNKLPWGPCRSGHSHYTYRPESA